MHNYMIETERLILRPMTVADAPAVFEWVSDPMVARYMVYPTYTDIEDVKAWLRLVEEQTDSYEFGFVRKSDGKLIGSGSIGLDIGKKKGYWGFGYNFRQDCWGMGYATEAVRAMIDFAHETFGAVQFCCSHVDVNKASGHVIEKCGLHFTGYGHFEKLDGSCPARSMEYEGILFE